MTIGQILDELVDDIRRALPGFTYSTNGLEPFVEANDKERDNIYIHQLEAHYNIQEAESSDKDSLAHVSVDLYTRIAFPQEGNQIIEIIENGSYDQLVEHELLVTIESRYLNDTYNIDMAFRFDAKNGVLKFDENPISKPFDMRINRESLRDKPSYVLEMQGSSLPEVLETMFSYKNPRQFINQYVSIN